MNNKEKFREYLKQTKNTHDNFFQDDRINTFIRILDIDLPKKLVSLGEDTASLLLIEDFLYLRNLKTRCLKGGDLHEWNISISSMEPSSALLNYHNFLYNKLNDTNVLELMDKENNPKNTNIILYGAPGVGKTHNYQRIISMIENEKNEKDIFNTITDNKSNEAVELDSGTFKKIKNEKRVEFVTFHQSYSYEDFIEGYRPSENGDIKLKNGVFKNIVDEALKQETKNFYIVIDEINRGNISKIFGELITLIEEDKRDKYEVTLPYSKESFKILSNLYIIATMNSTDKSIATIDIALRRRFTFLKMKPNLALVEDDNARDLMKKLNEYIGSKDNLGEDYMLGHSYFMKVNNDKDLEFIKEYKIKPLLEEYFYSDDVKLNEVLEILK